MDALELIVLMLGMAGALALGWFFGSRPIKGLRGDFEVSRQEHELARGEVEQWRGKFNEATVNMAAQAEQLQRLPKLEAELVDQREAAANARSDADRLRPVAERVHQLDRELQELRAEKEKLAAVKAGFERGEAERTQAHEKQIGQLTALETKLEARFGELASKAVEGAHDKFLKQADERFGHAGKQNEEKLKALLQPVQTTLERYEQGLKAVEQARNDSYGALKEAVAQLSIGNETVRRETQRLANVMRSSPKARGRWGEEQLRTISNPRGWPRMSTSISRARSATASGSSARLRHQAAGDRCIVVDVKCPLVAFEQAFDEEDETLRTGHLLQHALAMKTYANDLGRKGYWRQFDLSPDFVIMFIPASISSPPRPSARRT
jgi:DNA recombination protein RmuC